MTKMNHSKNTKYEQKSKLIFKHEKKKKKKRCWLPFTLISLIAHSPAFFSFLTNISIMHFCSLTFLLLEIGILYSCGIL